MLKDLERTGRKVTAAMLSVVLTVCVVETNLIANVYEKQNSDEERSGGYMRTDEMK